MGVLCICDLSRASFEFGSKLPKDLSDFPFALLFQKVRRSPCSTNPKFSDTQDIACVLRNWGCQIPAKSSASRLDSSSQRLIGTEKHHQGPELVLTPIQTVLFMRDETPMRRNRRRVVPNEKALPSYSIPMSDILVVETYGDHDAATRYKLNVTTLSLGYFEFDGVTRNGHDILMAFLKASVDPERIIHEDLGDDTIQSQSSQSLGVDSDVDTLNARQIKSQVDRETWSEKLSQRVGKVVHSLEEMSGSFCDVACCRDPAHDVEVREKPPVVYNLEMDEETSFITSPSNSRTCTRPPSLATSVESEIEVSDYRQ